MMPNNVSPSKDLMSKNSINIGQVFPEITSATFNHFDRLKKNTLLVADADAILCRSVYVRKSLIFINLLENLLF